MDAQAFAESGDFFKWETPWYSRIVLAVEILGVYGNISMDNTHINIMSINNIVNLPSLHSCIISRWLLWKFISNYLGEYMVINAVNNFIQIE